MGGESSPKKAKSKGDSSAKKKIKTEEGTSNVGGIKRQWGTGRPAPAGDTETRDRRAELVEPHLDSYNYFVRKGIHQAARNLLPVTLAIPGSQSRLKISLVSVRMGTSTKNEDCADHRLLPRECREHRMSYKAPLWGTLRVQLNDLEPTEIDRKLGEIPIMVRSAVCHLAGMTEKQMIALGEEPYDFGGYFITNGNEKAVRLLALNRRNYIIGLLRPSFTKRGPAYTKYGCMLRCVRGDQTGNTLTLHYLNTGNCTISVKIRKQEYLIPAVLILKALTGSSDQQIFAHVTRGDTTNTFVSDRVEVAIRDCAKLATLRTRSHYLQYLGQRFRVLLGRTLFMDDDESDEAFGEALLEHFFFVQCPTNEDKWHLLILMMQKLYGLVSGSVQPDSPDSLHAQEVLLPGHLMTMMVKEKMQDYLAAFRDVFIKDTRPGSAHASQVDFADQSYIESLVSRNPIDIGKKIDYFMATGNLVSQTGLDLMQVSGYSIVAERLNFLRYVSHFRSIHRGQFFTTMKSTAVRKLLPESWGFVCPVHTPDGGPCGLLNHLTAICKIDSNPNDPEATPSLVPLLISLGASPGGRGGVQVLLGPDHLPITLDGLLVGHIHQGSADAMVDALRMLRSTGDPRIPDKLEIGYVPVRTNGLWAGLFLFTTPARMMRPVKNIKTGGVEKIGTLEQIHMEIAVKPQEILPGVHSHVELDPMNMLSVVAQCTPFSDMNQSPRNMYQCQMGKQTMGTPMFAYQPRVDNKVYRIITPQIPLVRNQAQDTFNMDDYPTGANAVVAVISYTGYDMEDAMIINKGAYDRGFGNGHVYTHYVIELAKEAPPGSRFSNPRDNDFQEHLDSDGLPMIGEHLQQGMALWRSVDPATGRSKMGKHKNTEPAVVDSVRVLGDGPGKHLQRIGIKLKYDRRPIIGDKFSSRHGQKGVLSCIWPAEDMPFSENGIIPDVIINPNAFPSRMTIGMLVESMAGKAGAMHGYFPDSTPFRFDENNRAIDHFGEQLASAGYNYYGSETLYSGSSGLMMEAEIFMGVVYYQRLRHMVSDKYQCRATGPINKYTKQPVKGRKAGGGVRFGEMERDSLISHGAAFLLRDRLMTCSDISVCDVCGKCGSMIAPLRVPPAPEDALPGRDRHPHLMCNFCKDGKDVVCVAVPFVFRYLLAELAAMNIKVTCEL